MPTSYPLSFVCVFWGEKYRTYFLRYCLPSMLAPGNAPVLTERRGCKFFIATTADDWQAVCDLPLLRRLAECVEVVFLDIGLPGKWPRHLDPAQMHMTMAQRRAMRLMFEDRAYGCILAPDLIVSDGMVARLLELMAAGMKAILAPALRFEMVAATESLTRLGYWKPDAPLAVPARVLGGLARQCLHSEIQRYNWAASYFSDYPISVYWETPGASDLVVHTSSWAIVAGSYAHMERYYDDFLDETTVDMHYIYEHFFKYREEGTLYLVKDSDELVFFSVTPETDFTCYPFVSRPANSLPLMGEYSRIADLRRFCLAPIIDPFRRWAYTIPCHFHEQEITPDAVLIATRSQKVLQRAVAPEGYREQLHVAFYRAVLAVLDRCLLIYEALKLRSRDDVRKWVGKSLVYRSPMTYRLVIATVHCGRRFKRRRST